MEVAGHAAEAVPGIGQQRFGRLEALSGGEAPAEILVVDTGDGTDVVHLVQLEHALEAARIDQHASPGFSQLLGRRGSRDCKGGVVLVAAAGALAGDALQSGLNPAAADMALQRPAPRQMDEIEIVVAQVETERHRPFEVDRNGGSVDHLHAAGDHIIFFKHAVGEHEFHLARRVTQRDLQRLGRSIGGRIAGRKSGQFRFPRNNPVTGELEIGGCTAVRCADAGRGEPEIAGRAGRILLGNMVARVFRATVLRIRGERRVGILEQRNRTGEIIDPAAVVQMGEITTLLDHKYIRTARRIQLEDTAFFVIANAHGNSRFFEIIKIVF